MLKTFSSGHLLRGMVSSGGILRSVAVPFPVPTPPDVRANLVRLFSSGGRLLALARPTAEGDGLRPFLVIP